MNTLRSTERHLTLITFQRRVASRNTGSKAGLHNGITENLARPKYKGKQAASFAAPKYPRFGRFQGKIKCFQGSEINVTPFQQHSTAPLADFPLLNPNKMPPKNLKDSAIQPLIRPLTLPRFPKDKLEIPSVTKVLGETMPASSRFILDRWKEAMIKKLGSAGFAKYQAETFERGRLLHALIEKYLLSKSEPTVGQAELTKEIVQNLWKSIEKVVRDKVKNVRLVEHIVTHPTMNYRGIVDCVACYEDELVVIDFKTAEKPKKTVESLFDNPLQVTAYCGALNCDPKIPELVIDRNICSGVVIVAYVDGTEASVYRIGQDKIEDYWKQWSVRLEQYSRLDEMRRLEKKNESSKV